VYDGKFDIMSYAESDPMRTIIEPEIINYLKSRFIKHVQKIHWTTYKTREVIKS
jgi:hypothetical protein